MGIGTVGVWAAGPWLRSANRDAVRDAAAAVEGLGFGSLWLSAGFRQGVPDVFADVLGATERLVVGSGILSVWHSAPQVTADAVAALDAAHPGRFLLGLGASHQHIVEQGDDTYRRPYSKVASYLADLAATTPPVAGDRTVLAALGPRMLRLAGDRTAGAHPYFVPVEHTAWAREVLGPEPLLVPEQAFVLDTDVDAARRVARRHMARYLPLPNYANALLRLGWTAADLADGGSDALVDAVVVHGGPDDVAARVRAHLDAGASSVLVQALPADPDDLGVDTLRAVADVLL